MEAYPQTTLPLPLITYSVGAQEGLMRTQFQSGRIRSRARYSRASLMLKASWLLTQYEYQILQAFVELKIKDGADWFTMQLNLGEEGPRTYAVRIQSGVLSASREHPGWYVTATLESRARALATQAQYDALIAQELAAPGT